MNFSNLDTLLEDMPARGIPACELAVSKDGEVVFHKCVGYSDSANTTPATKDDIFWIFSATKVITCIAAMRLVESGVISLDDPVSKYIPEYAHMMIKRSDGSLTPAQNTMTILHLFTMTGGMTYDFKSPNIINAEDKSTLGIVRAMAKDPLIFEPGTHYRYRLCHDVLAAIVEVVSGMRYSEYLEKNIFKPLGIKDMGFRPNEEQKARFTAMYSYRSGLGKAVETAVNNPYRLSDDYDSGGAGLFATVSEYIKIISVIACGGTTPDGYVLLRPESIAMMQKNMLCDDALDNFVTTRLFGYGWGLCGRVHCDPVRSFSLSPIGEFGWDGAAGAFVMIDPKNRIALYYGQHVKGCQFVYHTMHYRFRDCVYQALEEK